MVYIPENIEVRNHVWQKEPFGQKAQGQWVPDPAETMFVAFHFVVTLHENE